MTESDITEVFALLERRLQILEDLASSVSAAKPGTTGATIVFLEHRTAAQCSLLAAWARVEAELQPWRRRVPELFAAGESGLFPGVEVAAMQARGGEYRMRFERLLAELRSGCQLEAAVLRRSRRTAAALCSLLASGDSCYTPPAGGGRLFLVGQLPISQDLGRGFSTPHSQVVRGNAALKMTDKNT